MATLLDLESSILRRIISYLPQNSVCNLASSNFKCYELCKPKLYERITIQREGGLLGESKARDIDYLDSTQTIVYGFKHPLSDEKNFEMIAARLEVLIQSMEINESLKSLIKSVTILGEFNEECKTIFKGLLTLLEGQRLEKVAISSYRVRMDLKEIARKIHTSSLTIDNTDDLTLLDFDTHELIFPLISIEKVPQIVGGGFNFINLKSLRVHGDVDNYWHVQRQILKSGSNMKLKAFKLLFQHGCDLEEVRKLLNYIGISTLENLEISVGCNKKGCNQDCLIDFYETIMETNPNSLKRVSIRQIITYTSHEQNELFDLNTVDFLQHVCEKNYLIDLYIEHKLPSDGYFADGLEGNYLRRAKIYTDLLPSRIALKVRNIILPNLMTTFACYEQQMNNFLYNGCRCNHCVKYLDIADDFLFHHKYYNSESKTFRDLITNQIVYSISDYLSKRLVNTDILSPFDCLNYPLRNIQWNFHDNAQSVPYRCLEWEVTEEGDFDAEKDLFYDSKEYVDPCKFGIGIDFNANYGIVVSHYLDDLLMSMIDLYRGDAESAEISDTLVDGMSALRFKKILINGINYNFDKELNGTNYLSNVYDNI